MIKVAILHMDKFDESRVTEEFRILGIQRLKLYE